MNLTSITVVDAVMPPNLFSATTPQQKLQRLHTQAYSFGDIHTELIFRAETGYNRLDSVCDCKIDPVLFDKESLCLLCRVLSGVI